MTLETKLIVGPEDILAIRFECSNCHASVSIPIGNGLASHISELGGTSCAVCRNPWQIAHNSAEQRTLLQFANGLVSCPGNT